MLDDIDSMESGRVLALAAVQFRNKMGSHIDTLYGESTDTVKQAALSAFVAQFLNRHSLRGAPRFADTSANGLISFSELKYAVDSMYRTPAYEGPDNRRCGTDDFAGPDTTKMLDDSSQASVAALGGVSDPSALIVLYNGDPRMRITNSGYVQLEGSPTLGAVSGLYLGFCMALQTDGDLVYGDTLLENQSLEGYLDTISTGLMFRNSCDSLVFHINSSQDTARARAWSISEFLEFQ
jgi:hypothetical protein